MRLNFFTPLPELRTDIANMSATMLPELAKLADVRAWTVQETWRDGLGDGYEIWNYDPDALPIRDFNWADVNFYNLGNDATYHRAIFDVARRIPGFTFFMISAWRIFLRLFQPGLWRIAITTNGKWIRSALGSRPRNL